MSTLLEEAGTRDLRNGLALLSQKENPRYFRHFDDVSNHVNRLVTHPFFGMEKRKPGDQILFVGAGAPDMTVEAFVAAIRFWIGPTPECIVQSLRITEIPMTRRHGLFNNIFFEVSTEGQTIISGDTNRKGGAGTAALKDLEDVMAVLSIIHSIPIKRVPLSRELDPRTLHA